MKRWMVVTRVTQSRTYFVDASDEKAAEVASIEATADLEEDENEETMTISEVPTSDDELSPQAADASPGTDPVGGVRHD